MYLSGDAWLRRGVLKDMDIQFSNAGGVLFDVRDYVPALMDYLKRNHATLNFFHNLDAMHGPGKSAAFEVKAPNKDSRTVEMAFSMSGW